MRVFFICHICIVSYGGWVENEAGGPGLPILGGKVPKTRARTPTLYTTINAAEWEPDPTMFAVCINVLTGHISLPFTLVF